MPAVAPAGAGATGLRRAQRAAFDKLGLSGCFSGLIAPTQPELVEGCRAVERERVRFPADLVPVASSPDAPNIWGA